MCLSLVTIKNPRYKQNNYVSEKGSLVQVPDSLSRKAEEYIKVPCGKCAECRQLYVNSMIQRAIVESFSSWVFFVTLTYDNKHLEAIDIDGENFYFANYDHVIDMFKRFRASGLLGKRDFRYLAVNEYGSKKHRPHFHVLLFVSRLEGDTEIEARNIEDIIFNNLGNYFSKNVGTRKNPIYEKLFTFKYRYRSDGKCESNYFVKLVEPNDFLSYVNSDFVQDKQIVKCINYLVGYVNKPDNYSKYVNSVIERYKDDIYLYEKYKRLLKSQVRVSKGFGCGFSNGKKFYMDKISVRCSTNTYVYTELLENLPSTIEEFSLNYEELFLQLQEWRKEDFYRKYRSFKSALNNMTSDEYILHCLYVRYYKREFSEKYHRYKADLQTTISYHYKFAKSNYLYSPQIVKTYQIEESPLYKYLRAGVEDGIRQGVPFLAFKQVGKQSFDSLCKYYRDRVCTIDDTLRMFKKLGVKNFQEYLEKFNQLKNTRIGSIQQGNILKYYNDDEVDHSQVQTLISGEEKYSYLF